MPEVIISMLTSIITTAIMFRTLMTHLNKENKKHIEDMLDTVTRTVEKYLVSRK